MSSFSKQTVGKNVEACTDTNDKDNSIQNDEISSTTKQIHTILLPASCTKLRQTVVLSSGINKLAPSTYTAPNNQSYISENQQFSSPIQKSSHPNYQVFESSRSTLHYFPSSQSCVQKSSQPGDEFDSDNSKQVVP